MVRTVPHLANTRYGTQIFIVRLQGSYSRYYVPLSLIGSHDITIFSYIKTSLSRYRCLYRSSNENSNAMRTFVVQLKININCPASLLQYSRR